MANSLTSWTPSPSLGLAQRAEISRNVLSRATSPREAVDAAERLIGQWPHARPPDAKTYAASLAAVLAAYPLGLVQECCDPRTGLARSREFPPTVAALVEWLDGRLEWHQTVARYKPAPPPKPELPDNPTMAARVGQLLKGLVNTLRDNQRAAYTAKVQEVMGPRPPWDGTITPALAEQLRAAAPADSSPAAE